MSRLSILRVIFLGLLLPLVGTEKVNVAADLWLLNNFPKVMLFRFFPLSVKVITLTVKTGLLGLPRIEVIVGIDEPFTGFLCSVLALE